MPPDMIAEGWLEHDGGLCPVPERGVIPVLLRDGRQSWSRFGFWVWDERAPLNIDIVAWRPDEPQAVELAA